MTDTRLTEDQLTPEGIRGWLVERVAYYLERTPQEINPDLSFADYGLDSVYAFALCGDIEDALGVPVEPTLVWDFDTIGALTAHLVGVVAEERPN
ncbi:acyl carrier protein [Streptomyces mirabilis]|uniref:acyl carrier protein n=1 Tax=Streptomyces mirabilis TaxID=68239 RepID=UPI0034468AE7